MLPKLSGSSLPTHWLSEILLKTPRRAEWIYWSVITQWSPTASIFLAMSSKQIIDQWMFCAVQKPHLLFLVNLQSNKRQKKETLWFSHQHFAYTHLSQREIFHSLKKKKSRKLFTFLSFLNQSSCITSYNIYRFIYIHRFICPLRVRIAWQVGENIETRLSGKKRNF